MIKRDGIEAGALHHQKEVQMEKYRYRFVKECYPGTTPAKYDEREYSQWLEKELEAVKKKMESREKVLLKICHMPENNGEKMRKIATREMHH